MRCQVLERVSRKLGRLDCRVCGPSNLRGWRSATGKVIRPSLMCWGCRSFSRYELWPIRKKASTTFLGKRESFDCIDCGPLNLRCWRSMTGSRCPIATKLGVHLWIKKERTKILLTRAHYNDGTGISDWIGSLSGFPREPDTAASQSNGMQILDHSKKTVEGMQEEEQVVSEWPSEHRENQRLTVRQQNSFINMIENACL